MTSSSKETSSAATAPAAGNRSLRCAAMLAILACAGFAVWKLVDSSFRNDGSSFIRHHYLMLQEEAGINEMDSDQRLLRFYKN